MGPKKHFRRPGGCVDAGPTPCWCCRPGTSHERVRRPPWQEPRSALAGTPEEPVPGGNGGSASNSQPDLEENIFPLCDLVVNKPNCSLSNAPEGLVWVGLVAALELQGWWPRCSWAGQGWAGDDGLTSCSWAGQCPTQPHGLKLPWGEVLPSLAEYGWKKRMVLCCGCHICPNCWWGSGGIQYPEAMRNWAHIPLQWGLVRPNHERHLAEVGGDRPAPGVGGTEGGEAGCLGTKLFLLGSQKAFWKADVSPLEK